MYLIDTHVISEARKGTRGDAGVRRFFATGKWRWQPVSTALVHNPVVAIRNHRHFNMPGVEALNPCS